MPHKYDLFLTILLTLTFLGCTGSREHTPYDQVPAKTITAQSVSIEQPSIDEKSHIIDFALTGQPSQLAQKLDVAYATKASIFSTSQGGTTTADYNVTYDEAVKAPRDVTLHLQISNTSERAFTLPTMSIRHKTSNPVIQVDFPKTLFKGLPLAPEETRTEEVTISGLQELSNGDSVQFTLYEVPTNIEANGEFTALERATISITFKAEQKSFQVKRYTVTESRSFPARQDHPDDLQSFFH